MSAPRQKSARWRKSKGHHWGKWELWRGDAWLAHITEVRLRGGASRYIWSLVGREPSGQTDGLAEAKLAARLALTDAEITEQIADLDARHEGSPV
jgi:hypothetical protein